MNNIKNHTDIDRDSPPDPDDEVSSRKPLPIKIQFALYFVIFILASFLVITCSSLAQVNSMTTAIYNRISLTIVEQALPLIDVEQFGRLCKTLDSADPFYEETRLKLLAFKEKTDCLFLYTMAPVTEPSVGRSSAWRFIIDGSVRPGESDFSSIGDPEDVSDYGKAFWECQEAKEPRTSNLVNVEPWGRVVSTFVPILDNEGQFLGILGCDFDGTELYEKLQSQLRAFLLAAAALLLIAALVYISLVAEIDLQNIHLAELTNLAEADSEAKNSFLVSAGQEIRASMNVIVGMSELAQREEISDQARDYVGRIRAAGSSLILIINDILDFSREESGKMEIHEAEYHLAYLLNDVIRIINLRLAEKQVSLVTEIDSGLPPILIGDEVRIRQMLLGILDNTVKYTREGTITLRVNRVGAEEKEGAVVQIAFEIADTGTGIKPEDMTNEETGSGPAVSRNLCRLMGGEITAKSEYGKGSVFTVILPQKVKEEPQ
ncbi:hypothetical protein AGMMS50268_04610 [Spirochaetia bacterium]|nr:hypothetical protein AGMMS50268_04610 [Spirochaetia bacterium]